MSASVRRAMTLSDFLVWDERQELRYEFDGFGPVAMTGGTLEHQRIQMNLYGHLFQKLRGKACRAFSCDMKIEVAGRIRYPDAFIACSDYPRGTLMIPDPIVVFEIISPSTDGIDRIVKLGEYRDTPSIQCYVMLEQDFQGATILTRQCADWIATVVSGDAVLSLPEIEVELPLGDLYDGVALPEPPSER